MGNGIHLSHAEAFVESLNGLGVDHIFFNPGGTVYPIQGAISQYKAMGKQAPKVILCTHESVAVAAAHGYAMVSGKPQVVLVFDHVGIYQGGGQIVNMSFGRMPVVLVSGVGSTHDRLNWLQEPCDQRSITRDYVKWDHKVQAGENMTSVLEEAFRVASTEPCGPVCLSIPLNIQQEKTGELNVTAPIKSGKGPEIEMGTLQRVADRLVRSQNPIVLTAYSGRHPQSVEALVELAETLAMRVITTDRTMNFPSTHPLCPGIDEGKGRFDHYIDEADLLLLIDYDFPGHQEKKAPRKETQIIHIDIEALKRGKPIWGRTPDVLIEGDSSKILPALSEVVRGRLMGKPDPRFRDRFNRLKDEHRKLRDMWRSKAMNEADQKPISPEWLAYCLNEIMDEEDILVQQAPSNTSAMVHQVPRTKPGTLYGWGNKIDISGGSMGWPLGAGFGAKLAAPDRRVVSLIGDGGFIYGSPVATLWGASAYNAPFLTIVCNNQRYNAITEGMRKRYGEETVSGEKGFEIGAEFRTPPDYALIAKACNAYGQTVEDPDELLSALKNGVDQVQRGKPAVVNVRQR
ncbi:MAG: thiamine pyrophosphate-requiring protein [Thermodesulfobacteriota bacterium]